MRQRKPVNRVFTPFLQRKKKQAMQARQQGVDAAEVVGEILQGMLQTSRPVRLKDLEEAQTALVTITKELANSGQIALAEGEEDGKLIY